MKILSLILARKSSKKIKNKNKILFKKKKLIEHTFILSKRSNFFIDTLLSSDDEQIIKMAKKYKILAPWKRPKNLCKDYTPSFKAVIHACNWYEKKFGKIDGVFILQPTSPFRKLKTIKEMIKLFILNKKKSVVCVSKVLEHPEWMIKIKNKKIKPFLSNRYFTKPSQKLKELYRINGLGFLVTPEVVKKQRSLIPNDTICYINSSRIETIDIDDFDDLKLARKINNNL